MKKIDLETTREFKEGQMMRYFLIAAGATFPVHSHDLDGELSILVIEGDGFFLGEGDEAIPAKTGDILISEIREPHGVRANTDMRIIVTIAPPI